MMTMSRTDDHETQVIIKFWRWFWRCLIYWSLPIAQILNKTNICRPRTPTTHPICKNSLIPKGKNALVIPGRRWSFPGFQTSSCRLAGTRAQSCWTAASPPGLAWLEMWYDLRWLETTEIGWIVSSKLLIVDLLEKTMIWWKKHLVNLKKETFGEKSPNHSC